MINPIKFIQEVKQEAFKVTWPTWKETLQGALMVFVMAVVMSLFFLLLDQVLKFFFFNFCITLFSSITFGAQPSINNGRKIINL